MRKFAFIKVGDDQVVTASSDIEAIQEAVKRDLVDLTKTQDYQIVEIRGEETKNENILGFR
jgi:hypothetical protein